MLCGCQRAIFAFDKVLVLLLRLKDLGKVRADVKLVIRGQDFDLLELFILHLDTAELDDSQDG